ncbi:MAG: YraN family protein [Candidatus Protistobacter heckmanni]|nr:YraN family protein [Candidatus Protistobacter heckmanni]
MNRQPKRALSSAPGAAPAATGSRGGASRPPPGERGAVFEARSLDYLLDQGLALLVRNYRCKAGEIDLILREPRGALVFVEVRARAGAAFGGAAASVGAAKQARLVRAASLYLARRFGCSPPPCRFDVIAFEGGRLCWHRDAFAA